MIRLLFSTLLISFTTSVYCQKVNVKVRYVSMKIKTGDDTIYYRPSAKLMWTDFRGKPPLNNPAGAVTSSGFAYNADIHFDDNDRMTLELDVFCYFTRHDSWKKPATNSAYHLEHEQHHFDITYLATLNFIKSVKQAHFTPDNYNRVLSDLFNTAYDKNIAMQHKYDSETQHSIDKVQQESWNQKITEMLRGVTLASAD